MGAVLTRSRPPQQVSRAHSRSAELSAAWITRTSCVDNEVVDEVEKLIRELRRHTRALILQRLRPRRECRRHLELWYDGIPMQQLLPRILEWTTLPDAQHGRVGVYSNGKVFTIRNLDDATVEGTGISS